MFPMVGTTLASARTNFLFLLLLIYPQSWMVGIIIDVNMANVATCPSLGQAGGCLVVAGVCSNVVLGTSNFNLQKITFHFFSIILCGLSLDYCMWFEK